MERDIDVDGPVKPEDDERGAPLSEDDPGSSLRSAGMTPAIGFDGARADG